MDDEDEDFNEAFLAGKEIALRLCNCVHCHNSFFVREMNTDEFDPRYCCYCGIKFQGKVVDPE